MPEHPMGIIVPPATVRALNDSVDVLLEGISRELPDRPRATSHSDGQAAARYHVEHAVRASDRAPPRDEPKVVIERAARGQTNRVARYAGPVDDEVREWTDTTAITTHSVASRVVIALAAGVIVVVAIFVALQRTTVERIPLLRGFPAPASPATALFAAAPIAHSVPVGAVATALPVRAGPEASRAPAAVVSSAAAPTISVTPPPPSPADVAPAFTAAAAESLPSAAASNDAAHRQASVPPPRAGHPKAKPVASASKLGSDLSEFKTNF